MKKISILSLSLVLAIVFVLSSCSKYEEGPSLSLLTKTARLTGSWKIDYQTVGGVVVDESVYESIVYTLEKDGTGTYSGDFLGITFTVDLEWQWVDGKEEVEARMEDGNGGWEAWETAKILKLENKEFWTEIEESGVVTETHYVPAE